jgi:hypothetical protein
MNKIYLKAYKMWREIYEQEKDKKIHDINVINKKSMLAKYMLRMEMMYFRIEFIPNGVSVYF